MHAVPARSACRAGTGQTGAERNVSNADRAEAVRRKARHAATEVERLVNRDVWTVVDQHPNGDLRVAHTTLAYATKIADAQGRTVDRSHVVVTPRTNSASLYVGMTCGRDHNHAHVLCDSHDHTEFELGDLTAHQAFANAITRDPDGQLSAQQVRLRWQAAARDRAVARAADRQRQTATTWWNKRQRYLNPAPQAALTGRRRHHHIIDDLAQLANDEQRHHLVNNALSMTYWRSPTAADEFITKPRDLQHCAPSIPTRAAAP